MFLEALKYFHLCSVMLPSYLVFILQCQNNDNNFSRNYPTYKPSSWHIDANDEILMWS